ncbi:acetyl-CoA carboxylase biotin carboxyl carrier protein [Staphylococcus kloosii]|jgi:acetyl-CoA carboxylase biotin carboxyl carrier protein|uniref:Acetyl-CoA carboxylase biotin carboxyl carrier protein subunit n=1 Tax=Staphylococcus kloosii TaxID=29384 RepID=A0A151A4V5_9STAP|nr:biotin/lipoyl-containing protein [Staphylococcus kloosii]AVQ36048.1 acetyl-CoA carboxylase biotin carboxyl carrier protein subunit [Staphylococcus kloosii]KYH14353.1 acetyl-CoA carboxylase biotin carboxyl carrier protein subunit [Staphylococcus kloosii]MBF7021947.1 acetyl-CoA carboxylase biotin carboxyl carrier protein subunit [Staphylococcus kloosii]MBF7029475.1 acetyl-CoA carboxylase biotin carboxyl carrier protein subunit [Staphylococcus kloosii]MCD8878785.1 acetyl-CoA carboxylase biotin
MNLEQIEKLITLVKENDVKKFRYKDYSSEIDIDFTEPQSGGNAVQHTANVSSSEGANNASQNEESAESDNTKSINASMVGTFFLQDEKELTNPIIEVGSTVNKGDVIGYIEAMKVLNEVVSDVEGTVSEIVVDHGTQVEYNQTLIKVD